jgi:hypothetical protein
MKQHSCFIQMTDKRLGIKNVAAASTPAKQAVFGFGIIDMRCFPYTWDSP